MAHPLIDRGADRGTLRFCVVVAPSPALAVGASVATDRGPFCITSVGRTYPGKLPGQGLVANHYLDVDAGAIGAPAALTPEVIAHRAASQAKAQKAQQAWRAAHPKEVAAMNRASGERLRAWQAANPEAVAEQKRKSQARLKAWRASHPKEVAAHERKRVAGLRKYHAEKKGTPR
jgi:hypothetical protein